MALPGKKGKADAKKPSSKKGKKDKVVSPKVSGIKKKKGTSNLDMDGGACCEKHTRSPKKTKSGPTRSPKKTKSGRTASPKVSPKSKGGKKPAAKPDPKDVKGKRKSGPDASTEPNFGCGRCRFARVSINMRLILLGSRLGTILCSPALNLAGNPCTGKTAAQLDRVIYAVLIPSPIINMFTYT